MSLKPWNHTTLIWSVVMLAGVATGCSRGPKQPPEQQATTTDSEGLNTAQTLDRGQSTQPSERDGATQKVGGGKTEGPRKELAVDLGGGVQLEFVLIPAGEFLMGDEQGLDPEKPVHKVTITKPFYLGKYEVTQEAWEAVMGNNPSHFKGAKNPVEQVNWQNCQDFLAKLNEKFRAAGAKFSLPTEAQWESACRAGTTTRYSFGNDAAVLADYAWYVQNSNATSHARARRPKGTVFESMLCRAGFCNIL